ncbi:glycoside hydrolase family 19 protein [Nocardia sp. BMG111209]|uniref:glycoside hydrolase family 19 protein n=1 Tax=Nocardia sp. BMG111209 TaxID=1160137 RepID=UPI0003AA46B4|nr:glycoside hydrolase family 19 protein [Nocardia sp. BMG111209]
MTPPRMPPPRSVVEAWRALEAALGLRALFDRSLCEMESLSGAVRTECHRLDGGGWQGAAYDTVLDHVEAAHHRNQLLWDRLETLRDTGAGALTDLHYTALAALDYAADAEAAGCTVADDWTVHADHPTIADEWSEVLTEALTAVTRAADRGRTAILGVSNEFRYLAAMFGLHTPDDPTPGESPEADAITPASHFADAAPATHFADPAGATREPYSADAVGATRESYAADAVGATRESYAADAVGATRESHFADVAGATRDPQSVDPADADREPASGEAAEVAGARAAIPDGEYGDESAGDTTYSDPDSARTGESVGGTAHYRQAVDTEEGDDMGETGRTDDVGPATDRGSADIGSAGHAERAGRTVTVEGDHSSGAEGPSGESPVEPPERFGGNGIRLSGVEAGQDDATVVPRYPQSEPDAAADFARGDPNSAALRSGDFGVVDAAPPGGPPMDEESTDMDAADDAAGEFADDAGSWDSADTEPLAAEHESGLDAFGVAAPATWHTGPVPGPHGGVTVGQLTAIMPDLSPERAVEYLPALNAAMAEGGITTPLRQAAFLAQLAHESGQLRYFEEFGDDGYFTQYDPGQPNTAAGNTQPGDGPLFHGRGPIQLTGRGNYRDAGHALGLDLEGDPASAARPDIGFRVAQWYWSSRAINVLADLGDFAAVTAAVNGGHNGLAERESFYRRALEVLR